MFLRRWRVTLRRIAQLAVYAGNRTNGQAFLESGTCMVTAKFVRVERSRTSRPVKGRRLDALKDIPDIRDRVYQSTLLPLRRGVKPPDRLFVMDQGADGACAGFALAATVNLLVRFNPTSDPATRARRVSPHMLYVNARRHDEWPGDTYEGSSLRGALRGFYNCGACRFDLWKSPSPAGFSLQAAKDARLTSLGAYYRLRPHLPDYHAALTETGVIYVSASVHKGWDDPKRGIIPPGSGSALHAFAIVGYDDTGFVIQNSWGPKWGKGGLAHWSYADWSANIEDAWVLQLALPSAACFGLGLARGVARTGAEISRAKRAAPSRQDVAGHFVHVDNGAFSDAQPYWSNRADVEATAGLMGTTTKYDHFLFYAHGGLNSPDEAAIRTAAMIDVFTANRIYPYSVFYDTGLLKTIKEVILGKGEEINQRAGGLLDIMDALIEKAVHSLGTRLWDEMKSDARLPFEPKGAGDVSIRLFVEQFVKRAQAHRPMQIHLVGHSTGAILIGHVLAALDRAMPGGAIVDSCSLMAPACSIEFFQEHFRPRLGAAATAVSRIKRMKIYNLDDTAERADEVTRLYNKSLLYLVSNAFEPTAGTEKSKPLLGMAKYADQIATSLVDVAYAPASKVTNSTSHGGFDNDPATLNDILGSILGAAPARPFSKADLNY